MAELVLVRHGQASVGAEDYDVLSPLGWQQSRALGSHWRDQEPVFERVLVGPRRRQRETLQGVREELGEAARWPDAELWPALDEHQGAEVVSHYRRLVESEEPAPGDGQDPEHIKRYLRAFQHLTRQWVNDELATPEGLEPWATFRQRVEAAIDRLMAQVDGGQRTVAFTSGGVVAAAVGRALRLDDQQTMELSWRIRNASVHRFLISPRRFSLDTFNETPHLSRSEWVTFV